MDDADKQFFLSDIIYLEVIQKWMGKFIEAKIVQQRTSTFGTNKLSHKKWIPLVVSWWNT